MRRRIGRLLGLSAPEWPRVVPFATGFFLITGGVELGRVARDAYFLNQVGARAIPYMYVLIAVVMVAASTAYAPLQRRLPAHVLLNRMQAGGALALVGLSAVLALSPAPPGLLPYAVFCAVEAYLGFLLLHFWNFANAAFDAGEGRRLFPIFGAAGLVGSLAAGLAANVVAALLGAHALFAVWAAILLGTVPLGSRMGRAAGPGGGPGPGRPDGRPAPALAGPGAVARLWRQPLIRTLAYMTLPLWIAIYVIEYSYYDTMNRVFSDKDRLAGFLGVVVGTGAVIGVVLQTTVTPWCLRRLGVGSTSLVYPLSLTAGATALLVFSLFPEAAGGPLALGGIALLVVFARLCDVAVFFSVYDSAQQLLYYAIPDDLRYHARTLMSGALVPLCMAGAGLLLLGFRYFREPVYHVAFVGVLLAFLLVAIALSVTPDYLRALLANLDPRDTTQRGEVLDELAKLETSDARYALLESITAAAEGEAAFALDRLLATRDDELLSDLEEVVHRIRPGVLAKILAALTPEERVAHRRLVERASRLVAGAPGTAAGSLWSDSS
jgi:ATP/ADP translocase